MQACIVIIVVCILLVLTIINGIRVKMSLTINAFNAVVSAAVFLSLC